MIRPVLTATALALVLSAPAIAQQEQEPEAAPTQTQEMEATDPAPAEQMEGQAADEPAAPDAGMAEDQPEEPAGTDTGVAGDQPEEPTAPDAGMAEDQPEEPADPGMAQDEPAAPAATEQAAEEQPQEEIALEGGFIPEQQDNQLLASELMNASVIGAEGDDIGDISDFLVDPEGGIHGVVVSVGGFLGLGAKDVALPWTDVQHSTEEQVLNVNYTREDLENAPDFMTRADIQAEQDAAAAQQQAPEGAVPAPAAPSQ